ncbi:MAG: YggS family pyridoxal phosphate-dependent enzyme [Bacteroidota bacterium]|jgi:pyridoxal phosphate enzyme (YggS family)
MSIAHNLDLIRKSIPEGVTLIAVSKTKPASLIHEAYDAGQRHFGENRVQELLEKATLLPKDINWHLIGHLQTNKVRYIAPFIHLIHSVDSIRLLEEVNKQGKKFERTIDCLLQFHIAKEETKFGLSEEEGLSILNSTLFHEMTHVRVRGVMGMSTLTDDSEMIHSEFRTLRKIFDRIKAEPFKEHDEFNILSMGMSGDFRIAIMEGSTMVRVGSAIFGDR